jgi:hypothetical protein
VDFGEKGGGRRGFQSAYTTKTLFIVNSFLVPLFLCLYLSNQQDLELKFVIKVGVHGKRNKFYFEEF